jgi:hypothetical protein
MMGPGVYVLIGPADTDAKSSKIYVGETDVLKDRLDWHQKNKEFWTRIIIFTAKDKNLNKAHVRYLEARLLAPADEANRAELENGTSGALLPALSDPDKADMESSLADMLLIYPVLGLNAFEKAAETTEISANQRLFLTGENTKAEAKRVPKDSWFSRTRTPAWRPSNLSCPAAFIFVKRLSPQRSLS